MVCLACPHCLHMQHSRLHPLLGHHTWEKHLKSRKVYLAHDLRELCNASQWKKMWLSMWPQEHIAAFCTWHPTQEADRTQSRTRGGYPFQRLIPTNLLLAARPHISWVPQSLKTVPPASAQTHESMWDISHSHHNTNFACLPYHPHIPDISLAQSPILLSSFSAKWCLRMLLCLSPISGSYIHKLHPLGH